ncbi:MAG TPA: HD-GYP domain-containing protein, partial [Armatimonadota bacterium]|jgi:HD-GYP domain-containing protein (c-di-GMP phosphodiesterase class II)
VTRYALQIAGLLNLSQKEVNALKIAGLLHDIGKLGLPDAILRKTGSLTRDERTELQHHSTTGSDILTGISQMETIVPAILHHHERWDGAGYPEGLSGESIPKIARIIAVADALEAMTSDRPYRKAMPIQSALLELRANAGKQFDPEIVDAFIDWLSKHEQEDAA